MSAQTFGTAIGKLIFQKRKALGLTQAQLAEDAFLSSGKTRRISELEGGLVANPHPKTLDPLIVTLGITEAEIEECARQVHAKPDPDLDSAYRNARNLIEALARQFESSKPEASFSELDIFLRSKAQEWATLRKKIAALEAFDADISNLSNKANEALANGQFEAADALLAEIEPLQERRVLDDVRKLVQVRVARGDLHIVAGEPALALSQYLAAKSFLMPFSEAEAVELLGEIARRVYESGRRSQVPYFEISISLLKDALSTDYVVRSPLKIREINYRLSLVYRNEIEFSGVEKAKELVDRAIAHGRAALKLTSADDSSEEGVWYGSAARVALGNALLTKSEQEKDKVIARSALDILREADKITEGNEKLSTFRCHARVALANGIMVLLDWREDSDINDLLDEAIKAYRSAIEAAEDALNAEVWGNSHVNLGILLSRKAGVTEDKGVSAFLRIRAISAFNAAIEMCPSNYFPVPYAKSHMYLANTLVSCIRGQDISMSEFYLARAIASYEVALAVFDRENFPLYWASIQMSLGGVFATHSQFEGVESSGTDRQEAVRRYELAVTEFNKMGCVDEVEKCNRALEWLHELQECDINN